MRSPGAELDRRPGEEIPDMRPLFREDLGRKIELVCGVDVLSGWFLCLAEAHEGVAERLRDSTRQDSAREGRNLFPAKKVRDEPDVSPFPGVDDHVTEILPRVVGRDTEELLDRFQHEKGIRTEKVEIEE